MKYSPMNMKRICLFQDSDYKCLISIDVINNTSINEHPHVW